MVKRNALLRSRAFLVEFIIVILFFSIACGIIVRVFAGAHEIRRKANDLTIVLAKTQNIAEYAKASESKDDYKAQLEKLGAIRKEQSDKDKYIFYYDKEWKLQRDGLNADYEIEIACNSKLLKVGEITEIFIDAHKVKKAQIKGQESVYRGKIYNLQAVKYYPNS